MHLAGQNQRARHLRIYAPALLVLASLSGVCLADARESADLKALAAQVRELQAQVQSLRQAKQRESTQAPEARSEPSVARAVLQDADRQSRLMDLSGMSAGWVENRGFFIRSDDGKFLLSPFVLFQARYATSIRQEARPDGRTDTQSGFEIRRLQLGIDGNVFSPDLTYRIFWQSSELTSGNLSLLMAWVQYRIHDTPWVIGGGQFKDPLDHEQLISDALQLANDRTFVDDTLAGGEAFSKGVDLRYDDDGAVRAEAALTSGFNANNSTFQQFPTWWMSNTTPARWDSTRHILGATPQATKPAPAATRTIPVFVCRPAISSAAIGKASPATTMSTSTARNSIALRTLR